jgi:YHS domain-containing protein
VKPPEPVDVKPAASEKTKADAPAEKKPADAKPVAPAAAPAAEKKAEVPKPVDAKPEAKPAEKKTEEKKPSDVKPDAKAAADAKPAAAVATVNTKCPVSEHLIEAGFTALVDNKTVGFCCDKCLAKFNKEPAKYADKIVADAKN